MQRQPPHVSVVIPTKNEAAWLDRALSRLKPLDAEIIVADNESTDSTREIALASGCIVVDGGRPGAARNAGAAVARGELLMFLDADALPSTRALEIITNIASTPAEAPLVHFKVTPMTSSVPVRLCFAVMDLWFVLLDRSGLKHGLVNCMALPRTAFMAAGGFDEDLEPGEDVEFIHRASRLVPVRYERDAPVFVSARRFRTENGVWFSIKTVMWEVLRLLGSRRSVFRYRWDRHDGRIVCEEDAWLAAHGCKESR
jgi:glycosyltransferase involved in cell wall biosynthesis